MAARTLELNNLYTGILEEFYSEIDEAALKQVETTVSHAAPALAAHFYSQMLAQDDAAEFLDNDLVDARLNASMNHWISNLFVFRRNQEVREYVEQQIELGRVHARIDLPLHLFAHGARTLKRDIVRLLQKTQITQQPLLVHKALELLDIVTMLIIESYLNDFTSSERQTQALRMDVVGRHLVVECERMRASLLDWLRHTLTELHQTGEHGVSVRGSDFGLWAVHKAAMLLEDNAQAQSLCQDVDLIEAATLALFGAHPEQRQEHLKRLNDLVTQTAWKLTRLADQLHQVESGRDPLTSLFNRRYLDPILKREVRYSIRHHHPFALLLIDVDQFKAFNDAHGHAAGDIALRETAALINDTVRVSDVVFRYGGEEFMVLLSEMNVHSALEVAEKLRQQMSCLSIYVSDEQKAHVTVSVGVALHDGHPDYERVIQRADRALYKAKQEGRDCVRLG